MHRRNTETPTTLGQVAESEITGHMGGGRLCMGGYVYSWVVVCNAWWISWCPMELCVTVDRGGNTMWNPCGIVSDGQWHPAIINYCVIRLSSSSTFQSKRLCIVFNTFMDFYLWRSNSHFCHTYTHTLLCLQMFSSYNGPGLSSASLSGGDGRWHESVINHCRRWLHSEMLPLSGEG